MLKDGKRLKKRRRKEGIVGRNKKKHHTRIAMHKPAAAAPPSGLQGPLDVLRDLNMGRRRKEIQKKKVKGEAALKSFDSSVQDGWAGGRADGLLAAAVSSLYRKCLTEQRPRVDHSLRHVLL